MAKQYRRRNAVSSGRGLLRSVMLVCVSFFSGYLVASYLDIGRVGNWVSLLAHESSRLVPAPQLVRHTQKPKLEFYTLLTANHGAVSIAIPPPPAPIVATHTAVATQRVAPAHTLLAGESNPDVKSVAQKALTAKLGYTIQVAALRTQQDADRIKALLLLRGFQANVSTVASNGVTWFRVMVGPFASRAQAAETQSVLIRRERMNGMIRTLDRTA